MTPLYLLEPAAPGNAWAPFTGVRPVAELRAGLWRIRERWERALGQAAAVLAPTLTAIIVGGRIGSGMAAETTLLLTLRPGDHVLLADDVYGGTYRLLAKVLAPWGLSMSTCDLTDLDAVAAALRPETRFVWVETPSNPLLKIVDLEGNVRDGFHDLRHLTARLKPHPFDPVWARVEAGYVDLEMGNVAFARPGHRCGNPEMMVMPPAFGDGGWLFAILPFSRHGVFYKLCWFSFLE